MSRNFKMLVGVFILTAVWIGGCSLSLPGGGNDASALATESAKLIESGQATQTAAAINMGQTELPAIVTETPSLPTIRPTETEIPPSETPLNPTSTPIPSLTPLPSFTPLPPTVTIPPIPCDQAGFDKDLTIPDGSVFAPGSSFTKTWRLRNTGTCIWTSDYGIVFDRGTQMGGSSSIKLSSNVAPGNTIDVSITLTAPSTEGKYRGYYRLANASGVPFGTGLKNSSFYVDIVVQSANSKYALDFAATFCNAEWTSGAGTLTCPGSSGDSKGYVQRIDNAVLETGSIDNEPALMTVPQAQTDGVIRGKFPNYTVQSGDTFRAIIFCASDAKDCSVRFQLDYIVDGETTIQTAINWTKAWDGKNLGVSYDLTGLAGKKVRFILTVFANGEMKDDRAEWLAPRILHK